LRLRYLTAEFYEESLRVYEESYSGKHMKNSCWGERAKKYDSLNGLNNLRYIEAFISSADFSKDDVVLDVGTGTGLIANALAPLVKEVVGIDSSQDMLKCNNWSSNVSFVKRDIRNPLLSEGFFDKVTARLVFHHIIKEPQKAMDECYRVLKKGGKMVLSEAVPPCPEIKDEYAKIFKVKEKRLVFLEEDLVDLMRKSGFKNIAVFSHTTPNFSVKNWLKNNGLTQKKQSKIFMMHIKGSESFKQAYNMKLEDDDCLIDVKYLILVAEK